MKKFTYDTIMVHAGTFHADDVMCVAICKVIKPTIRVERVFKVPEDVSETTLVADIGFGAFDHHQADVKLREDGHKRAACGLLLEAFGDIIFDEEEKSDFEKNIIYDIEDADNGIFRNPLSSMISKFNPTWIEDATYSSGFDDAVNLCIGIIKRYRLYSLANKMAKEEVNVVVETVNTKGLAVLKRYLPLHLFSDTAVKLVVCPSNRGGYNILTIKVSKDSFEDKISLPESWLENPPEGCTFVHRNRFIASFKTEHDAIVAANSIL